jgi:hypothetical protein
MRRARSVTCLLFDLTDRHTSQMRQENVKILKIARRA